MGIHHIPAFPINRWYKFIIAFCAAIFLLSLTQKIESLPFLGSFSLATLFFGIVFWITDEWLNRKYTARLYEFPRVHPIADAKDADEFTKEYDRSFWIIVILWGISLAVIYNFKLFL